MHADQKRYWPFDVLPNEQRTRQHQQEICFLEAAYEAGYNPYMFGSQNFAAATENRAGEIIYRGCRGKHWEIFLVNAQQLIMSAHVDDFEHVSEALLLWLRGDDEAEIVEHVRTHLFSTAANPAGFVLYSPAASAKLGDG